MAKKEKMITFMGISDQEIAKLFKLDEVELTMVYNEKIGRTTVNIGFTKDNRAFWIAKYKRKFYGNMTEPFKFDKDNFVVLDVYLTMLLNAKDTLAELKNA